MIIKKNQTKLEHFSEGKVFDYPMPSEKIGISYQEHNGRAPKKGWGVNKICYEIYYIISGKAEIYIEDEKSIVENDDVVVIFPGQKSYMKAHNLKLITITSPNWSSDQYSEVE